MSDNNHPNRVPMSIEDRANRDKVKRSSRESAAQAVAQANAGSGMKVDELIRHAEVLSEWIRTGRTRG